LQPGVREKRQTHRGKKQKGTIIPRRTSPVKLEMVKRRISEGK